MIPKKETTIEVNDQTVEETSDGKELKTAYHGYGFTEVSKNICLIKLSGNNK